MIKVLIVDDNAWIRKSIRYLLEETDDIQVVGTASNGAEAVIQANMYSPDVIIMDFAMPVMDGIEASERIRASHPLIRILIISISDSADHIRRAGEVGALGYIVKDRISDNLLAAIRAIYHERRVLWSW